MVIIRTRGKEIEIPGGIDELTPEQYVYYCHLVWALGADVITLKAFRVRWFSFLVGLNRIDYTLLKIESREELAAQISAIDGFFNQESGRPSLLFTTTRNLLPSYKGFNGPGDWLEGMKYGDFIDCLNLSEAVRSANEDDVLDIYARIARIMYSIPDSENVPDLLLFHAPAFLSAVWRAIMTRPVEINGRNIDFRIIFKGSGSDRRDDGTGWAGITFEVAAAGVFGNVKDVEQVDLWSVLLYLYRCKFEYLEEKRKSNSSK